MAYRKWTEDEDAELLDLWEQGFRDDELADRVGRGKDTCMRRVACLLAMQRAMTRKTEKEPLPELPEIPKEMTEEEVAEATRKEPIKTPKEVRAERMIKELCDADQPHFLMPQTRPHVLRVDRTRSVAKKISRQVLVLTGFVDEENRDGTLTALGRLQILAEILLEEVGDSE